MGSRCRRAAAPGRCRAAPPRRDRRRGQRRTGSERVGRGIVEMRGDPWRFAGLADDPHATVGQHDAHRRTTEIHRGIGELLQRGQRVARRVQADQPGPRHMREAGVPEQEHAAVGEAERVPVELRLLTLVGRAPGEHEDAAVAQGRAVVLEARLLQLGAGDEAFVPVPQQRAGDHVRVAAGVGAVGHEPADEQRPAPRQRLERERGPRRRRVEQDHLVRVHVRPVRAGGRSDRAVARRLEACERARRRTTRRRAVAGARGAVCRSRTAGQQRPGECDGSGAAPRPREHRRTIDAGETRAQII